MGEKETAGPPIGESERVGSIPFAGGALAGKTSPGGGEAGAAGPSLAAHEAAHVVQQQSGAPAQRSEGAPLKGVDVKLGLGVTLRVKLEVEV